MRPSFVSCFLVHLSTFLLPCAALQALSNSPCALQCGNVLGSTSGSDLVCQDSDYGTAAGIVFKNCVTCQLGSTYVDPVTKQTDLQWALYNLRYATSWCLFGYPNNPNVPGTPCTTSFACGSIQGGIEFNSLSPNASTYGYCGLTVDIGFSRCRSCLAQDSDEFFLTNFVTALNGACQQQPTPGNTVSLQGSLFSKTLTNITTPSATPISTNNRQTGGLTLGAKVGIAIAAILAILATTGFCIICGGRRRRRRVLAKHQQESGYSTWLAERQIADRNHTPVMSRVGNESAGGFFDSPQSQRPLFQGSHWAAPVREEDSPASALGEKAYFSPYSSNYSSPVTAQDQVQNVGREWPLDRQAVVGGSSPLGRSRSIEKRGLDVNGDRIELQYVAPVLLHPGNGRAGQGGLTDEDMRRGNAL